MAHNSCVGKTTIAVLVADDELHGFVNHLGVDVDDIQTLGLGEGLDDKSGEPRRQYNDLNTVC